jgi:hypothetical protein
MEVQTFLFATRDQPRENVEDGHGSCHFITALSNVDCNTAVGWVFKLEQQQNLDKCKSWDTLGMTRNTKEHQNTLDNLHEQAELAKENSILHSDGSEDSQENILQSSILEIVNTFSPLSIVPNVREQVRSKTRRRRTFDGSASPSPRKSPYQNKPSPAVN